MVAAGEEAGVPLFRTTHLSSTFIERVQTFLEERSPRSTSMHGVLLDVFGVGILLLGKSGIGKSEIALDLVMRGHRLVADDIVDVKRRTPGRRCYGAGSPRSSSTTWRSAASGSSTSRTSSAWPPSASARRSRSSSSWWSGTRSVEYDRLGVEERKFRILDVEIPMLVVPVRPGRNMTTIIEVAARNHLLKLQGHHSAREFQERLNRAIALRAGARRVGERRSSDRAAPRRSAARRGPRS